MTTDPELSFLTRLWFAWLCSFRVLFDGRFAARVWTVCEGAALLPAARPLEPAVALSRTADITPARRAPPKCMPPAPFLLVLCMIMHARDIAGKSGEYNCTRRAKG